jgi:tetratricopeptide (TPR) repeat protein
LVPHRGVEAWMRSLRVIVRETGVPSDPRPNLSRTPRTCFVVADFSPAAVEASIREDVSDPSLPEEARMQALVTEASLDYAHGRTTDAIAKYQHVLGYYQKTENLTMQAMVMHGLGDVCGRAEMHDEALKWYECATVPAAACNAPVVLAIVTRSLGQLSYTLGRYPDAEGYFDGLDALAGRLLDPENKAYALEWKGESQRAQGRARDAIATWETASTLCRNIGMPEPLRLLLARLQPEYRNVGMPERAHAAALELAALPQGGHSHG